MRGSGPELQAVLSSCAPWYDIAQEYDRARLQLHVELVQRRHLVLAFLTYRSDGREHKSRRRKASHRNWSCAAVLIAAILVRSSIQRAVKESEGVPETPGLDPGRQCCRVVKVPERDAVTGRYQGICAGPRSASISAEVRECSDADCGTRLGKNRSRRCRAESQRSNAPSRIRIDRLSTLRPYGPS